MDELLSAESCEAVAVGTVVMLCKDRIVYAGPIKGAPDAGGRHLLMNRADFEKLKTFADRRKH